VLLAKSTLHTVYYCEIKHLDSAHKRLFYNEMRYINLRFTYLLTYLLTYRGASKHTTKEKILNHLPEPEAIYAAQNLQNFYGQLLCVSLSDFEMPSIFHLCL